MQLLILAAFLSITAALAVAFRRRYRSLSYIRGPSPPSWLFGHDLAFLRQKEVGEKDFKWVKEYGATWRIASHLGTQVLMTADPKAMQHVFHKSGYNYVKRRDHTEMSRMFTGPGIISAQGEVHQRHRKIMNPAFSAPQLRTFLTLFQDIGVKMCDKWKTEVLDAPNKTVYVNKWLARTTLDIIGEAAFAYDYGALDQKNDRLSKVYSNIFIKTALHSSKRLLLWRSMWNYFPDALMPYVKYTPTKEHRHIRHTTHVFQEVAGQVLDELTGDVSEKEGKKDVMSILIRANSSENPKTQLTYTEMTAQMQSLTFAGHETTANTLSWMLWELAKHPEYQAKMRTEVRTTRAAVLARGDTSFTIDDLDSMTSVLNAIKETLRFHPIVFNLWREAVNDDVIPLSEPIISATGETIHAIPIRAGQWLSMSICSYNRLPQVWGDDAEEWNPDRFLDIDPTKQVRVGVFANLMSFSAGVRGCIGWRFSLIEMQALAAELLERFEFGLPKEHYEIVRVPAGLMIPLVKDKLEMGSVMPLSVSLAQ
ncbi:hypothetical protein V8D89_015624 [Ganoderma adspersum]